MVARIHVSSHALGPIHSVPQGAPNAKPTGLWYGIGRAWVDWCRSEMPSWVSPTGRAYHLTLDTSRMVRLRTARQVRAFTRRYRTTRPGCEALRLPHFIDWAAVARDYGGIEIAPYQWSCRFAPDTSWYYGWDVAGGCVWDAAVVTGVEEVAMTTLWEETAHAEQ